MAVWATLLAALISVLLVCSSGAKAAVISPAITLDLTPVSFNLSQLEVLSALSDPDALVIYSTNPRMKYLPNSDCVHRFGSSCTGRDYAWKHVEFLNERAGEYQSYAIVTNEHIKDYGNPAREIKISPPNAEALYLFGVSRSQIQDRPLARQELCFSFSSASSCTELDIVQVYASAPNDYEPVLLWSGPIPAPRSIDIVLRMIENAHRNGQQPKLMTLDAAVFTGVEVHPPSTRHPNIPPRAWAYVRKIDALDESRISYWPRERWTMWQDGLAETSTTFHPKRTAEYPQLSFSFSGHAVRILGPPRSWLPLPAGGLEVCVDGSCDFVDARHIYLNLPPAMVTEVYPINHLRAVNAASSLDTGNARDPVLLWSRNDLDYNRQHEVSVTLVAEDPPLDMGHGDVREGFVLHHVSYTEVIVPWELPEWLTFQIDLSDISEIVLAVLQTIALIIAVAIYLPLFLYTLVVIIYLIVSIWRFTIRAISSIFTRPASSRPTSPGEGEPFNQHSRDHHRHDNDHSHQHNYYGSTTDNFAQNQRAAGHGRDGALGPNSRDNRSAPPYSPSGPPPYYRRQDPRPPSYSTATNNSRTNGDGR